MALQEIDEAEIASLREHTKVLNALGANPKTRRALLGLLKELNPNVAIPEIDAAKPVIDEVESIKKQLAEEKEARRKDIEAEKERKTKAEIEEWQNSGRRYLRENGYEDAGIEKVEELMKKRGLTDYEAAEAVFAKQNPPEDPIQPADFSKRWTNFDKPDDKDERRKLLMSGEKGARDWQAMELADAMKEMAAKKRAGMRR